MTNATRTLRAEKKAARAASMARIAAAHREARKALIENSCPVCGAHVHGNSALTGWVKCDRGGAEGFRRDMTGPSCSWQGFTE